MSFAYANSFWTPPRAVAGLHPDVHELHPLAGLMRLQFNPPRLEVLEIAVFEHRLAVHSHPAIGAFGTDLEEVPLFDPQSAGTGARL
ncbi:MAG: hypothetical protein U5J83_12960 [Bryobacterales bacterium]|nr:hypothetical protein [Bryobacterales bacterium]